MKNLYHFHETCVREATFKIITRYFISVSMYFTSGVCSTCTLAVSSVVARARWTNTKWAFGIIDMVKRIKHCTDWSVQLVFIRCSWCWRKCLADEEYPLSSCLKVSIYSDKERTTETRAMTYARFINIRIIVARHFLWENLSSVLQLIVLNAQILMFSIYTY